MVTKVVANEEPLIAEMMVLVVLQRMLLNVRWPMLFLLPIPPLLRRNREDVLERRERYNSDDDDEDEKDVEVLEATTMLIRIRFSIFDFRSDGLLFWSVGLLSNCWPINGYFFRQDYLIFIGKSSQKSLNKP